MADLTLFEHPRCSDIFVEPRENRIERLKPDSILSLRRVGDLLRCPLEDVSELIDSGVLAVETDANGKQVVYGDDLQKFAGQLHLVTFTESDEAEDDAASDSATDDAVATAPVAQTTVTTTAPVPAGTTRANPALSGQADEPGLVRLRLSDLAALIRGDSAAKGA
ncbi:MAG: hypothetical protein ACR2JY_04320 [Chloroflexota bacterium]